MGPPKAQPAVVDPGADPALLNNLVSALSAGADEPAWGPQHGETGGEEMQPEVTEALAEVLYADVIRPSEPRHGKHQAQDFQPSEEQPKQARPGEARPGEVWPRKTRRH